LITSEKVNMGSAKTIVENNGIWENEIFDKKTGKIIQKFWINKIGIKIWGTAVRRITNDIRFAAFRRLGLRFC